MIKHDHMIFGVHVTDRLKSAATVQALFSEYGCHIKTRLGLHQVDNGTCAPGGVVILEMVGDPEKCSELAHKLSGIEGVEVQKMLFEHKG